MTLEKQLARISGAGALPTVLVLLWGAFDPTIIPQFTGLHLPIAAAALSLPWTSVKSIAKKD